MILKQRKAKASSRGLYLQDRELIDTKFQPGNAFTYVIDPANRKLVILPTEEPSGHTVSKRKHENALKPVIDIRSREALDLINDSEYLTVTICEDQIIVDAYKAVKEMVKAAAPAGKVIRLEQFMPVRRVSGFRCALDDLQQVVGGSAIFEQLEFAFDLEASTAIHNNNARAALDLAYIPLQIASLFSGAGMMDYGFKQAGFDIVFAVDNNPDACQTYRANLGHHIYHGDIGEAIRRMPKVPVVIGGSPCQGFSQSNRVSNYLDNPNNLLVRKYIEAVKASGCSIFVLENVPQLLTAGDGKFRDEIMKELEEFEISYGVVSCAAYGSAQLRDRSIMLGSKIGRIDLPPSIRRPGEETTVREAFAGLHDGIPNQRDFSKPKPDSLERMKHIPPGGNIHDLPDHLRTKSVHSNMYRRLEWDKPSITIANPRKAQILHCEEDRILTVRECARLQGLPDDYVFKGTLGSMQQQVANGVPVQLAQAIGRQIKKAIMKFNSLFQQPAFG